MRSRDGVSLAATVRRVGAHRRWDRECLAHVRGLPWRWDPAEGDMHTDLKVRWLAEDEIESGKAVLTEDNRRLYRLRLKKMALIHAAQGERGIMVMDVKSAFLYGDCRRRIYIELPRQDPKHGDAEFVGRLQKAVYGSRDAPQIWAKEVQKVMEGLGFVISMFQPSVYRHPSKDLLVVVPVDDFLCSREVKDLEWLFDNLAQKFELKRAMITKDW